MNDELSTSDLLPITEEMAVAVQVIITLIHKHLALFLEHDEF